MTESMGVLSVKDNRFVLATDDPSPLLETIGFKQKKSGAWEAKAIPSILTDLKRLYPHLIVHASYALWLSERGWDGHIPDWLEGDPRLFPFQKEALAFVTRKPTENRFLCGLGPGLGKSLVGTLFGKRLGGRKLVVAPLSLLTNWQVEIRKWTGQEAAKWHRGIGEGSEWVVTNYDTAMRWLVDYVKEDQNGRHQYTPIDWVRAWNTLIIDESILLCNSKSHRYGALKALATAIPNVLELSGAPVSRLYDDLWAQLNLLNPRLYSSYWDFTQRYCYVDTVNKWGWQIVDNKPEAEQLLKEDLRDIMFARTQDQVLDLPEFLFEEIQVGMSDEQYSLYAEMEETFRAHLPEGNVVVAGSLLAQIVRLIQLASNPVLIGGPDMSAKEAALYELLSYVNLPVIVWTAFIETADHLEAQLSRTHKVARLTGSTPEKNRQKIVDAFQAGETEVLIAHPGVGKYGHTLTRARTAIYLERVYSGDDFIQSLFRVRRIGTTERPHVIFLLSCTPNGKQTIDHVINKVLDRRKNTNLSITTGMLRAVLGEQK